MRSATGAAPSRGWRRLSALALAAGLAGCAAPRPPSGSAAPADAPVRSGRLALSVEDAAASSFSAGFELRGRPEAGELTLYTPLGGVAAQLRWQPGQALLQAPGQGPRSYPSLQAMVEEATGAPLPVAALFDWLEGRPTPVPGWEPDLSGLEAGRLRARRTAPPPPAELRLVLER